MLPRSDRPVQTKILCKHHRRYQGRFTRLASVVRSMTTPAAARLLLVIAVPLVIMPMPAQAQGNAQSAIYRVTFEGKWTTSVTTGGLPSGAHFSPLIGAVHNGSATFWSSGDTASADVEAVAELGTTDAFMSEIMPTNVDTVFQSITGRDSHGDSAMCHHQEWSRCSR